VAFVSVFVFHSRFFVGSRSSGIGVIAGMGAYGMCLFFFLSSYLITELLLRERAKTGTIHVRAFFVRRILRIWPLYFAFIGFTICLGHLHPRFRVDLPRVIALISLAGNWYMAKHGPDSSPAAPLWSISLEEQFYLVWPFLAKFGGRRGLGTISVLLLPSAWLILAMHGGVKDDTNQAIWCNSFVQFQFFALGALTALRLNHRSPCWTNLTRCCLLLGGISAWSVASWLCNGKYVGCIPAVALVATYILIGGGCVCLLLGLLGLSCAVIPRWAVYLGQISYGLYVFHWFDLRLVSTGLEKFGGHLAILQHAKVHDMAEVSVALLVTIGVAALSYRFYEYRFLRLKERFAFVKSRR
jgi:peptidoglycan/LPS O-acetylase OafA/YrhL